MDNQRNKLILEDTLNQIYNNNYFFDAGMKEFFFQNIQLISLNNTCIYGPKNGCIKILLFAEEMIIKIQNIPWRVHYTDINDFIIHFED